MSSHLWENTNLCKKCFYIITSTLKWFIKMWKKSGAWFYKEVPDYVKPSEDTDARMSPHSFKNWQHHAKPQPSNATYQYRYRQAQSDNSEYALLVLIMHLWQELLFRSYMLSAGGTTLYSHLS